MLGCLYEMCPQNIFCCPIDFSLLQFSVHYVCTRKLGKKPYHLIVCLTVYSRALGVYFLLKRVLKCKQIIFRLCTYFLRTF